MTQKPLVTPRVSVILCTYNRAYCLERTLQHILAQTMTSYELIIVDDGSTDATPHILKKYKKLTRVRCIRGAHAGVSAARNTGLSVARGMYIAYCDDDYLWHRNHLALVTRFLDTHPDCGMVYADTANGTEKKTIPFIAHPF